MPRSWKSRVSRAGPRILALLWAAYDGSRLLAYWSVSPPQLTAVAVLIPLWIPWAVATALLTAGALVPPRAGTTSKAAARLMRQWGMTLTTGLLMVWGTAFLISDFSRGWVTATSYVMLAAFSGWAGWIASRDVADVRVVREETETSG